MPTDRNRNENEQQDDLNTQNCRRETGKTVIMSILIKLKADNKKAQSTQSRYGTITR